MSEIPDFLPDGSNTLDAQMRKVRDAWLDLGRNFIAEWQKIIEWHKAHKDDPEYGQDWTPEEQSQMDQIDQRVYELHGFEDFDGE